MKRDREADSEKTQEDGATLTEEEVGITCYIHEHKSFQGIIKHRYSDFIVREIDPEGNVARLLDVTTLPTLAHQARLTEAIPQTHSAEALKGVLGEADLRSFEAFLATPEADQKKTVLFLQSPPSKDERTKIHQSIKEALPFLSSETVEGKIRVRFGTDKRDSTRNWSATERQTRFVLYKENKDTMDCLSLLASMLKVSTSLFTIAGTKDKRAVTSQFVTAFKMEAERLKALNSRLFNIRVGNFSYVAESLKLGSLSGNRFEITIRDVQAEEPQVMEAASALSKLGFINYFGMQRFGTSAVSTHEVGLAVLRQDWPRVCHLILCPRRGERADVNTVRQKWVDTQNATEALAQLPKYFDAERAILRSLERDPHDFYNAFSSIPRNLRLLYLHAYQSRVWNVMASERVTAFGATQVVVGDLVATQWRNEVEGRKDADPEEAESGRSAVDTKIVTTAEEAAQYSIDDVVLPLPGSAIQLPGNALKEKYLELLARDGLTMEAFDFRQKELCVPGGYRRLIEKPKDVEMKYVRYSDHNVPLTATDMDLLLGKSVATPPADGSHAAIVACFSLSSGCYATMCLRELLHTPTHFSSQKQLSLEAKKQKGE